MKHSVVGNSVVLRIAALHGVKDTANGRLLVQDVVELERNGERIACQERLRQLCIPNQLVGIHRCIGVTTTTLHVHVRRYGCTPRCIDAERSTISKLPCVEIIVGLQFTTVLLIVQRTIQLKLKPFVAVAESQTLANAKSLGDTLLRFLVASNLNVTYIMVIREVRRCIQIEVSSRVECCIECQEEATIPVTIDILRLCLSLTLNVS